MHIAIAFSGFSRVLAGVERDDLDVAEGTTVELLCGLLEEKYQDLSLERGKAYFMVNGQFPRSDQILKEGDKVQVFQLLAGG